MISKRTGCSSRRAIIAATIVSFQIRFVEIDLKQALYYLDKAARSGFSIAENNYGVLYLTGNAVLPKDENLARQLFTLAAKDNNAAAMVNLGLALDKGIGGNKDAVEARYWYEKAAQAGNFNGMYLFGFCLHSGKADPKTKLKHGNGSRKLQMPTMHKRIII